MEVSQLVQEKFETIRILNDPNFPSNSLEGCQNYQVLQSILNFAM